MGMHENDWDCLRMSHIHWGWEGPSMLIYIIRHAWEWIGIASGCAIMDEHVCLDKAWEWLRMSDNVSYSGDVWVIYGWVALYDMHDNEWECMRMTENDGESLIFKEGWDVHSMLIYIIRHAWDACTCMRLHGNVCACNVGECTKMHEIVGECIWMYMNV